MLTSYKARRVAGSGSEDLMSLQFGSGAIEPVGEPGQVTGRHFREEVMLQVEEHLEGDPVFHLPTQGACDLVRAVAVVVHGPYGEERGHALADRHDPHVIPEREAAREREDEEHPEDARGQLRQDPAPVPAPPEPEAPHMQPNQEDRPIEQSPPGAEARAKALQILVVHAMLVMLQVVALYSVVELTI